MKKNILGVAFFTCVVNALISQVPAGDRVLGFHCSMAENEDYPAALAIGTSACMTSTHLFLPWTNLESSPGAFDGSGVDFLDIANYAYPLYNLPVEFNIAVTNTVVREVPAELMTTNWDDPAMINHFNILLDSIFYHIPDLELNALMIGNESDILWGLNETEITQFKNFFTQVKTHAEELYFDLHGVDLQVGTTLTFGGLTGVNSAPLYHDLNEAADVIGVTYYNIGDGFMVLPPASVNANFDLLASVYADMDKPIYFLECGYPTSAVLNGTEQLQADFVSEVFNAWDEHYDQIKLIFFFMLHDWSQAYVDELAIYYGLEGNVQFTEYLRTLGLRTFPGDGEDKLGLARLRCEADARSFCDAECTTQVNEQDQNLVIIYPNPATDQITIRAAWNSAIEMTDITGRVVMSFKPNTTNPTIDISDLSTGVYQVCMNVDGQTSKARLLIR